MTPLLRHRIVTFAAIAEAGIVGLLLQAQR
jgi:hypothetical protein